MFRRSRSLIPLVLFLGAVALEGATPPTGTATLIAAPSPSTAGQPVTLTANLDRSKLPKTLVDISGRPGYAFFVQPPGARNPEMFRPWSTSATASYTPNDAGTYSFRVWIQLTDKSGKAVGDIIPITMTHTVNAAGGGNSGGSSGGGTSNDNKITWTSPITAERLGSTPSANIANKTIANIVNSVVAARSDGLKCNACHTESTTSRMYRPPSTTITPTTTINRGDAFNSTYRWNQSGSTGIVERFCAAGKPADLCSLFRKWAADGYLNP